MPFRNAPVVLGERLTWAVIASARSRQHALCFSLGQNMQEMPLCACHDATCLPGAYKTAGTLVPIHCRALN